MAVIKIENYFHIIQCLDVIKKKTRRFQQTKSLYLKWKKEQTYTVCLKAYFITFCMHLKFHFDVDLKESVVCFFFTVKPGRVTELYGRRHWQGNWASKLFCCAILNQ